MVTQLNDSQDSHLGLSDLKVRALNFQATLPPGVTVNAGLPWAGHCRSLQCLKESGKSLRSVK